jgi:predicted acetyltransferase
MVEYRPVSDDSETFHEYRSYAFRPEEGVPAYDPDEHAEPRDTRGDRRGIYVDGDARPRTTCRHYWLETDVRGDVHPTAGLASVATPPEHRRKGYVRDLLRHSLAEYRDRGDRFSILWPFRYRFYRRYGWDTANRIVRHGFDPDAMSFARDAADGGAFRSLDTDEYRVIEPVYNAASEGLATARSEWWWRHRVFAGHDVDPFVYAYERDSETAGYLVYTISGTEGERTMAVSELAAVDADALLALLGFCADHDSQVERVELRASEAVPVRELAADPDEIETRVENGPMVRIVDVVETLSVLSVPSGDAALTLAVEDPMVGWNDDVFELEASGGRLNCRRLSETTDASPDATLDVGALSQLVVGTRSATDLERIGRLETPDSRAVTTLEALFPESDVYLGHHF